MHRLKLLILLAIAACTAPAPPQQGFRKPGTQLYSNAVFQPERLQGRWDQVAAFAAPAAPACRPGGAEFTPGALALTLCLNGRQVAASGPLVVTGPGRLALRGADPAGIGQPLWVLWVDDGYRTLVIGTPSGDFGFILNRGGPLPPDRLQAAREILDWNGYDLTRLRQPG
ncbi:lipocalin family protein [Paracoccaceae bacterium Fryx2]|nr:lipocalin family protein [Paracoccaceae bacterium Fryx2]